jgi:hypothetical protein
MQMQMQQDELIAAFQRRLQSDPKLRAEFLGAPLGVMKREGVQVSPDEAVALRYAVAGAGTVRKAP